MSIEHCKWPGCQGTDGKAILTTLGICEADRARFLRLIIDLGLDYANLHTYLPKPVARRNAGRGGGSSVKSYGHPAEWASDLAANIAGTLLDHADDLAEFLGTASPAHGRELEYLVVRACHRFLRANFAALVRMPNVSDIATELLELHQTVKKGLGYTVMKERLKTPCPGCGVMSLVRVPPADPRRPHAVTDRAPIVCAGCGFELTDALHEVLVRHMATDAAAGRAAAIDALLSEWDGMAGPACRAHADAGPICLLTGHTPAAAADPVQLASAD